VHSGLTRHHFRQQWIVGWIFPHVARPLGPYDTRNLSFASVSQANATEDTMVHPPRDVTPGCTCSCHQQQRGPSVAASTRNVEDCHEDSAETLRTVTPVPLMLTLPIPLEAAPLPQISDEGNQVRPPALLLPSLKLPGVNVTLPGIHRCMTSSTMRASGPGLPPRLPCACLPVSSRACRS
jgi:hypothetical protein